MSRDKGKKVRHRQVGVARVGVVDQNGVAVGIDIGADGVRAALVTPGTMDGRPSVTVVGLGQIPLPQGAVVGGVVNDQGVVTRALKTMWAENKFEGRKVILGVTNQQVVVRDMTLPNLSPEQMAKALPFRAREVVPIPLDQALIDFTPLGPPDPESDTVSGLLIAAPRGPVLSAVHAVEQAGLQVARVDLSSLALLRAIADEQLGVEAVIDIGRHLTTIVIHNQGIPKVVRAVGRGGEECTSLLVAKGGMDIADAERAKCEIGVRGTDPKIATMVNQSLRPFVAEIRSSIQYFTTSNPGARLERVSITGGGARLPGLDELLTDQLEVPTRVVTPMQHVRNRWTSKGDLRDESAATAVSLGLAMGAAA